MSWAHNRVTTRIEDMAYCLMGLFGVNMPMIYGEGKKAFIRLQEEIIKLSDDYTILAWHQQRHYLEDEYEGLFAPCPSPFAGAGSFIHTPSIFKTNPITVDGGGIYLTVLLGPPEGGGLRTALLPCGNLCYDELFALRLKLSEKGGRYKRVGGTSLAHSQATDDSFDLARICVQRGTQKIEAGLALGGLAARGNLAGMKLMLGKGLHPLIRRPACEKALVSAAIAGNAEAAKMLLEDAALRGAWPYSPLAKVIMNNRQPFVCMETLHCLGT